MNTRNHSGSNKAITDTHESVKHEYEYVRGLIEALSEFNSERAAAFNSTLAAFQVGVATHAVDQTYTYSSELSETKAEFDSKLVAAQNKLRSKVSKWLQLSEKDFPASHVPYSMIEDLNAAMDVLGVKSTNSVPSSSVRCAEDAFVYSCDGNDHKVPKPSKAAGTRNDDETNGNTEKDGNKEEEVLLKETVALYKNCNGWISLDTKKSRSTLQLYKHKITQKHRMVVGCKGLLRVHCYVSKDMSFRKVNNNMIQFAARVGDETEETKFQSFALKVTADRVDDVWNTLNSVGSGYEALVENEFDTLSREAIEKGDDGAVRSTLKSVVSGSEALVENEFDTLSREAIEKGDDGAIFRNEDTTEEVVLESVRAQLIKVTQGKLERLTLKKGLVTIYQSPRLGHRMVYRNCTNAIKFESPVAALTMVKCDGSYIKFTTLHTNESYMMKVSASNAQKVAATLAVIIALNGCTPLGTQYKRSCLSNNEEDDDGSVGSFSTVGGGDDEQVLSKVRARPVQVLQGSPDKDCFFAIPEQDLYTKQLDEGTLELRRKSSGEQRIVWFIKNDFDGDLVIDLAKGTHIEIARYVVKTDNLPPFELRLIKIIARENLTEGVFMFRVSTRKVDKLYEELKKMMA
ncbi:hypothetical protein HJC23_002086 [Cyclotella cryptica]|uniref:RanBD1 domain-containing protein n=1 Tax=Cyclotella cryptica TaxID=29204 RepID=A0ABD3P6E3_9STRA